MLNTLQRKSNAFKVSRLIGDKRMGIFAKIVNGRRGITLWRKIKTLSKGNDMLEALLHRYFMIIGSYLCIARGKFLPRFQEFLNGYGAGADRESTKAVELCLSDELSSCDLDEVRFLVKRTGHADILNKATVEMFSTLLPYVGNDRIRVMRERMRL